jgi:hypothetical protein
MEIHRMEPEVKILIKDQTLTWTSPQFRKKMGLVVTKRMLTMEMRATEMRVTEMMVLMTAIKTIATKKS